MKTKKCKYCKSVFSPITTLQKNCFEPDCVTAWINEVKAKNWQKRKANLKRELLTVQDYVKLAQTVFNKYIRLRDKDKPCISCGNKLGSKFDCGHYYSAGGHWSVRFDERNCSAQCVNCNQHKHGNLIEYRTNLIDKIGNTEFLKLEAEASKTRKFTIEELKEIIKTYKLKIKSCQ